MQSVLVLAKSSPISDSNLFNNTVEVAQIIKLLHFARFVQAKNVNDGTSLSLLLLIVMVQHENDGVFEARCAPGTWALLERALIQQGSAGPNFKTVDASCKLLKSFVHNLNKHCAEVAALVIVGAPNDLFKLTERCVVDHLFQKVKRV